MTILFSYENVFLMMFGSYFHSSSLPLSSIRSLLGADVAEGTPPIENDLHS